jgi:glycosyltransferase involved in cell wall biosynthesis
MAETTRLIFSTLQRDFPGEYELHQIALFHCYAVTAPEWPVYPTRAGKGADGNFRFLPEDKYGQKTFPEIAGKIKPDIVFAFGDPQRVFHLCAPVSARSHKLILYLNFDGMPLPRGYGAALQHADLIITKTEFALNVLKSALPNYPASQMGYLYSPADLERFQPVNQDEKLELRRDLFPSWMSVNGFVFGWVGRNQWRKQTWLLYKCIHYLRRGAYYICPGCGKITLQDWDPCEQKFLEAGGLELPAGFDHQTCAHCGGDDVEKADPLEDIYLWLHMSEEPDQDWTLEQLETQFACQRGRDIHYTEEYGVKSALAPADIPLLYQLWDAMLYLSGGEGFGLPAWEAMCAGLPLVFTNYSGHGEFISRANAGLPVSGVLQPEADSGIWRMIADLPSVILAVRKLYFGRSLVKSLGENGRAYAQHFELHQQVKHWHEVFQKKKK